MLLLDPSAVLYLYSSLWYDMGGCSRFSQSVLMNSPLRSSNVSEFAGRDPASCKICSSWRYIRLATLLRRLGNWLWAQARRRSGDAYLVLLIICKSSCKHLGPGQRSQQTKILGEPATLAFDIRQQLAHKVSRRRAGAIHDRADLKIIPTPSHTTDHISYDLTHGRRARLGP